MSTTTIPGIKAQHAWITSECRTNHGDAAAVDEALRRLRKDAMQCLSGWPIDKGAKFHFVLTVERPAATMTPEEAEAQRRSFAYGNSAIDNPTITRADIDKAAAASARARDRDGCGEGEGQG